MRGCDAVIHFAAESHVDRSIYEPAPVIETNVTGTSSSAWPEAGGSLMTTMVQLMVVQSS